MRGGARCGKLGGMAPHAVLDHVSIAVPAAGLLPWAATVHSPSA